jgi:hypothetical protein
VGSHFLDYDRTPVIVFLSDGECSIPDQTTYDICNAAVRLGCVLRCLLISTRPYSLFRKGLLFYTVGFGPDPSSQSLRRMAQIAAEVHRRAPRDPLAPVGQDPCSFSRAIDTVGHFQYIFSTVLNQLLLDPARNNFPPHC